MSTLSSSAHDLANRIAGPGRYKFDVVVEGIAIEQARLVGGPFLALLWLQVFDFDGLTEWLVLGDACPNTSDASLYLETQLNAFQLAQTRVRASSGTLWEVEYGRKYVLPLKPPAPLRIEDTITSTCYGGPYHRVYLCGHVIGPFPGVIVGHELLEMLQGLHEVWQWFTSVGEAHRAGLPSPTIIKYIQE